MLTALKALFIIATTVFVGDILLMLVWKLGAERTKEPKVLLFANKTIMLTDNLLLGPSAMLTALSSNLLAPRLGIHIYSTLLLTIAMVAFILSGVVWSLFLIPIQKKQLKLCTELGEAAELPAQYFQLTAKWTTWGLVAASLVVLALVLVAVS